MRSKKSIFILILCLLTVSLFACSKKEKEKEQKQEQGQLVFKPGTYTGEAKGYGETPLQVSIEVNDKSILSVNVVSHEETEDVGTKAIDALPGLIVEKQSLKLDSVAGATVTSQAILAASEKALESSGVDMTLLGLSPAEEMSYKEGTYVAEGKGNNGPIKIEVSFSKDKIENITIGENEETPLIAKAPFELIPAAIVEYQSLAVDAIAGATVTSNAILTTVSKAVEMAGGNPVALKAAEGPKIIKNPDQNLEFDVVVVGGGLSGLMAATSASRDGAKVALVEKQAYLGGTSLLASGNMRYAPEGDGKGMVDSMLKEASKYRRDKYPDMDKLNLLGSSSHEVTKHLEDAGITFIDLEGRPYVHKPVGEGAAATGSSNTKTADLYIIKLEAYLTELGGEIFKLTPVTNISKEGDTFKIVSDTERGLVTFTAKAVVLASGDSARNEEILKKYSPESLGNYTLTASGNTGEVIEMALTLGATVYDDQFSMGGAFTFDPFDSHRAGFRQSETLDNSLIVSLKTGERKISESASSKFLEYEYRTEGEADGAWDIMDSEIAKGTEIPIDELVARTDNVRIAYQADTIQELAEKMNVDFATFEKTFNRYNELCEKGVDEDFGKDAKNMIKIEKAPFYAVRSYCNTRGIAGGLVTSLACEVVDKDNNPIPGLFASGSISSRPFYGDAYQGAAALAVAANMGKIAGNNAATYVKGK